MPTWYQNLRMKTCSLRRRAFTPGLTPGVLSPISDRALTTLHLRHQGDAPSMFRPLPIQRGDLVPRISATGTVEPEKVVDVGAQVAGLIQAFGKDIHGKPVDYGSVVDAHTVLARIDDALYVAD